MPRDWTRRLDCDRAPERMPYFLAGPALERLDSDESITFDDSMLLRGVLHSWLEPHDRWQIPDREALEVFLDTLLDDMQSRMGHESLELMVLSTSAKVREEHGRLSAMKMLIAGHNLLPLSSEIRSDLIMDLWAIVKACDQIDRESAFDLIRKLYDGIQFEELSEQVFDILDYINFMALSYLGDYKKRNWLFWRVISKRVRHKQLKHRMIKLLNPRPLELPDEQLWAASPIAG